MTVKYLKLEIGIHGLNVKDEDWANFLTGWVRECIKGCLLSERVKNHYNWRGEFDDDIEVEITEKAGEFDES